MASLSFIFLPVVFVFFLVSVVFSFIPPLNSSFPLLSLSFHYKSSSSRSPRGPTRRGKFVNKDFHDRHCHERMQSSFQLRCNSSVNLKTRQNVFWDPARFLWLNSNLPFVQGVGKFIAKGKKCGRRTGSGWINGKRQCCSGKRMAEVTAPGE